MVCVLCVLCRGRRSCAARTGTVDDVLEPPELREDHLGERHALVVVVRGGGAGATLCELVLVLAERLEELARKVGL